MRIARLVVATTYLVGAGVHIGVVAADPQTYQGFADGAPAIVREAWSDVFMAAPSSWGLVLAGGELVIGVLLLGRGRRARLGIALAIAFHVALMFFGWWAWTYAAPALVALGWLGSTMWRESRPAP